MSSNNKVLVTGATGKVGEYLVKELAARNVPTRVYVRNVAKAKTAFASVPTLEYAEGTNEDAAAFAKAVTGVQRLFLLTTDDHLGEIQMANAAKQAGVKHIVKLSAILANSESDFGSLLHQHGIAEQALLKELPRSVALTVLRPHDFFENSLASAASVKGMGKIFANFGQSFIGSIAAKDIAASAAGVLTAPIELHAGMSYTLTGPQALSRVELAALMTKVLGRKVDYADLDEAAYLGSLTSFGLPHRRALQLTYLGVSYRQNFDGHRFTTGWVKVLSGKEPTTWEQWLTQNKTAFQ